MTPVLKACLSPHDLALRIKPGASLLVGGFMGVGTPSRLVAAIAELGIGDLTIYCNDAGKPGGFGIAPLVHAGLVRHLVERIRAGGSGLGGVLTQTGLGTLVQEGKQVVNIEGKDWLLETPIRADYALLGCHRADYCGNLEYSLTATNFNPVMALAGNEVFAEPDSIVPIGVIPPDSVRTPGVLVDFLVAHHKQLNTRVNA